MNEYIPIPSGSYAIGVMFVLSRSSDASANFAAYQVWLNVDCVGVIDTF